MAVLAVFLTCFFEVKAEEEVVAPGTYIINAIAMDGETKIVEPVKVTVIDQKTILNKKVKEGINGYDFEHTEEDIKSLTVEELVKTAGVQAWSLEDGSEVAVTEVEVQELDSIERHVTFKTAKGTKLMVCAFANGTEIFGQKDYVNITGEFEERNWEIQYRTIFSVVFLLLMMAPVLLTIAIGILMGRERTELERVLKDTGETKKKKRKKKWFLPFLILSVLVTGISATAKEAGGEYSTSSREVVVNVRDYLELLEENKLEDYIRSVANIRIAKNEGNAQVELPYRIDFEGGELLTQVDNEAEKNLVSEAKNKSNNFKKEPYVTRKLKIGDHGSLIPIGVGVFLILTGIPLVYIWRSRRR